MQPHADEQLTWESSPLAYWITTNHTGEQGRGVRMSHEEDKQTHAVHTASVVSVR